MKNSSAILINHAENYLHQMTLGVEDPLGVKDPLSAVLSADDLLMFQQRCTMRVRNYPAVNTLSLLIRQAISADKSLLHSPAKARQLKRYQGKAA